VTECLLEGIEPSDEDLVRCVDYFDEDTGTLLLENTVEKRFERDRVVGGWMINRKCNPIIVRRREREWISFGPGVAGGTIHVCKPGSSARTIQWWEAATFFEKPNTEYVS